MWLAAPGLTDHDDVIRIRATASNIRAATPISRAPVQTRRGLLRIWQITGPVAICGDRALITKPNVRSMNHSDIIGLAAASPGRTGAALP